MARISAFGHLTSSDTLGRFILADLPPGAVSLLVRRLGFAPRDVLMQVAAGRTDTVTIIMAAVPELLPGLVARADAAPDPRLGDFNRHRSGSAAGRFFDRKQIEELRVSRLSDLLRRVPGIRIVQDRGGRTLPRSSRSPSRNCPPEFWIDGIRATVLNVDDVPIADIEALEVYSGPAGLPPEYNLPHASPTCGTVVIWTRLPGNGR